MSRQAQDELAFRKWRLKQQGQDIEMDALVTSWQDALEHLRETNQPIVALHKTLSGS